MRRPRYVIKALESQVLKWPGRPAWLGCVLANRASCCHPLHRSCACVQEVMATFPEACMGYGASDEFSFLLHKHTKLYGEGCSRVCPHGGWRPAPLSEAPPDHAGRRSSKIVSLFTSCFTSHYVRLWPQFLPGESPSPAPQQPRPAAVPLGAPPPQRSFYAACMRDGLAAAWALRL